MQEQTFKPENLRVDGRKPEALRPVSFVRGYTKLAPGSVLVNFGDTRVICTASVDKQVPPWLRGKRSGWVTAEYSMLPGSTQERKARERRGAGGRTKEIERLIGRSLRGVTDLAALAEYQITVDCDVLQADGGTRTAAITGGWLALHDACSALVSVGKIERHPSETPCAAVSVGIVNGRVVADLCYEEDVTAEVDMNVVMTSDGRFVEVQGTAEGVAFDRSDLDGMLDLAQAACRELFEAQRAALAAGSTAQK